MKSADDIQHGSVLDEWTRQHALGVFRLLVVLDRDNTTHDSSRGNLADMVTDPSQRTS